MAIIKAKYLTINQSMIKQGLILGHIWFFLVQKNTISESFLKILNISILFLCGGGQFTVCEICGVLRRKKI